jgi:GTP cyclohydrolase I
MTEFEKSVTTILKSIGENPDREGLKKTPHRVEKAFEYMCKGYKENIEEITNGALFETTNNEMVVVRDIEFYSLCEHHILPFFGRVSVAYIPNGRVIGLSKIPRIVDMFARRLQIQEQLTEQIADAVTNAINPKGVGVLVSARHMCMEMRGVEKVHSYTTTSALRGVFMKGKTREEFFNIVNSPVIKDF